VKCEFVKDMLHGAEMNQVKVTIEKVKRDVYVNDDA
jgi:hypothetical protein